MANWTEDRTQLLRNFWREGLSAGQIAKLLGGVTRNAVIGKAARLGLTHGTQHGREPSHGNGRAIANRVTGARLKSAPNELPPKPLPKLKGPERGDHNISWIKHRDFIHCAMFLPDQSGAFGLVCGKPVLYGTNWCSECTQIVYDGGRKKEAA